MKFSNIFANILKFQFQDTKQTLIITILLLVYKMVQLQALHLHNHRPILLMQLLLKQHLIDELCKHSNNHKVHRNFK